MSQAKIRLHDDLEKRVREFEPLDGNKVNMYVCGVTVYGPCHIGHARAYIAFDTIRRWLEYRGYDVRYIQNFTDVDDKIINKANAEGTDISAVSNRYIEEYYRDMDALGIRRADVYPKATEFIPEMLEMTRALIEKGFAYETDGNVFFEVGKFEGYGKLSGRGLDELSVQEPAPGKRNHADFALWKRSQPGEPSWDSPWGPGRPGWHLECSAMSLKIAGGPLDIHGGGMDLLFPHHENEIAQSEAFSGAQFSRYWMHNGFVEVDKEKMSKSLGNITNVADVLKQHDGNALRLFFLGAHYRMPISYSTDRIREAETALERFRSMFATINSLAARAGDAEPSESDAAAESELEKAFSEAEIELGKAMDDDFNTPAALAQIFTMTRRVNAFAAALQAEKRESIPAASIDALKRFSQKVVDFAGVLGLDITKSDIDDIDLSKYAREVLIGIRKYLANMPVSALTTNDIKRIMKETASKPQFHQYNDFIKLKLFIDDVTSISQQTHITNNSYVGKALSDSLTRAKQAEVASKTHKNTDIAKSLNEAFTRATKEQTTKSNITRTEIGKALSDSLKRAKQAEAASKTPKNTDIAKSLNEALTRAREDTSTKTDNTHIDIANALEIAIREAKLNKEQATRKNIDWLRQELLQNIEHFEQYQKKVNGTIDFNTLMDVIINTRNDSRNKKYWIAADALRDILAANNIEIVDMPDKTIWRIKTKHAYE